MENARENQMPFDITTIICDVFKNWWVILLGALAAAMLTFIVVNESYVPEYTTKTTFVVGAKGNFNAANNLSTTNTMAQTFQRILESNVMKKILCEEMGTNELIGEFTTEVIGGTNLLVLTVTAASPKEAIDLIHAIMDNYTRVSYYTTGNAVLDVLQEPSIPMTPNNPLNAISQMKKAFILVAAALCALFAFISYMRDTVKREDDIEQKLDARDMGIINFENKYKTIKDILRKKKKALLVTDPLAGFTFVENYKKLATKVDYRMSKENGKVLVITSVSENEGKSTVAANLAISLAEQAKKVLLIDGDFRRPSQFLIFDKTVKESQEVGEVLKGNSEASVALTQSEIPGLYLMIGKNCYASSTELVSSKRMKQIIDVCKKAMDYIIIDSPPAGLIGDAEVLAGYSDAVMLVVKQNYIYSEDINDVLDSFREHHSSVLGVVLNSVKSLPGMQSVVFQGKYGKYGKYGNYGRYGKYGNYAKNREKR